MTEIPIYQNKSSKFRQEIILGGRTLNITIKWNVRCECWFMDIEDIDDGSFLNSIKLVDNWLLIRQYRSKLPNLDGDFIIKAVNTDDIEITYDNLGNGFNLFHVSTSEADDWEDFYGVG